MTLYQDISDSKNNGLVYHMSERQFFKWAQSYHSQKCSLTFCVREEQRDYYDRRPAVLHQNCTCVQDLYHIAVTYQKTQKDFQGFREDFVHSYSWQYQLVEGEGFVKKDLNYLYYHRHYVSTKYVKNADHEKKEEKEISCTRQEKTRDYRRRRRYYNNAWKVRLKHDSKVKERMQAKKLMQHEKYDDLPYETGMTTGRSSNRWNYD